MKKLLSLFFAISLTLSACRTASTQPTPPAQTGTPTITPTATQTPTSTITPLPTIPTFTPTFDVSTIVTVTPAEKAECPTTNNSEVDYQFDFGVFPTGKKFVDDHTIESVIAYLRMGGNIDTLIDILSEIQSNFIYQDITNDNTPDLIIVSGSLFQKLNIIYCQNGQYSLFPSNGKALGDLFGEIVEFKIQDLNQNQIQDIYSVVTTPTGLIAKVWEWNGQIFEDLTAITPEVEGVSIVDAKIVDINNDNVLELVIKGQVANDEPFPGQPLRSITSVYHWNGNRYSLSTRFDVPQYRFQAIQDGDIQVLYGNFKEATNIYQEAIDSNNLDWWSKDRYEHNRSARINFFTPVPLNLDGSEYPSLAAYAYYRIILLHLAQGQEAEAASTYQTLQDTFGTDQYAAPYVEMATAFWEAYQSTQKMYDGCAAAIQYAVEHPEILTPLGSDYHGWQSHIYVPADVCPFR